jgi:hypothetical protein
MDSRARMRNDPTGTRDASHERAANGMSEDPGKDERELRRLRSEVAAQQRDIHDMDDLDVVPNEVVQAGATLALVVIELIPQAFTRDAGVARPWES